MFESKLFEIVVWQESYPCESIEQTCKKHEYIKSYAFALHDRDENKKPHYHIAIQTSETQPSTRIAKDFGVLENAVEKCKSQKKTHKFDDMLMYLIHFNSPEKAQYDASSVIASFDYIAFIENKKASNATESRRIEIRNGIINGEIREYNLTKFITSYEFEKFNKTIKAAFDYRRQMVSGSDRNMNVVFIYGATGRGKTTFAKERARKSGFDFPFISSASNDMFDNYKGQPCVILDDLRGSMFRFDDCLKLFDNYTNSTVKSRYYNKDLVECELLFITSSQTLDEFCKDTLEYNNEDVNQLKRRIGTYIRYEDEYFYVSSWLLKENCYSPELQFKNEIYLDALEKQSSVETSLSVLGLDLKDSISPGNDFVKVTEPEAEQLKIMFKRLEK